MSSEEQNNKDLEIKNLKEQINSQEDKIQDLEDDLFYNTEKKKLKSKMNNGVFFFILLCSFSATILARNHEDLITNVGNMEQFRPFAESFTKYSLVETVTCLAVYHYVVYNVILHRFAVSLLVGLVAITSGVYHFLM